MSNTGGTDFQHLHDANSEESLDPKNVVLVSKCACGLLELHASVEIDAVETTTTTLSSANTTDAIVDCHCSNCRHFHISAFVTYWRVPCREVKWVNKGNNGKDTRQYYRDSCQQIGPGNEGLVDRIYCNHCYTKMASQVVLNAPEKDTAADFNGSDSDNHEIPGFLLVNMGPVQDHTVPSRLAVNLHRIRNRQHLQSKTSKPKWPYAVTGGHQPRTSGASNAKPLTLKGGCRCGSCRFQIQFQTPTTEFQHCYCQLCRQMSGSAFQTWVPIYESNFQWMLEPGSREVAIGAPLTSTTAGSSSLKLVRTTNHGRRHMCSKCGSVMTIKYDDQPDYVWPAAGSFDDDDLDDSRLQLYRVCHICCKWKQKWYQLPDDGLERIDYAC